jgi:hypothetical protein
MKINGILRFFGQDGPTVPWAAGGRMVGIYAKKLTKS